MRYSELVNAIKTNTLADLDTLLYAKALCVISGSHLVNHRHKDARVYDSNDRLMYTRTYSPLHGFKEQENTDMNTFEVRYGFGRNAESLAYATFDEAKQKVDRIVRQTQHDEASIWQDGKKIYKFWYNGMDFHESDMRTPATTTAESLSKIGQIKAVRAVSDKGLREAKDFVEASKDYNEVARWVMERVYDYTNDLKDKVQAQDSLKTSNDLYKRDNDRLITQIAELGAENKRLQDLAQQRLDVNKRILDTLTKEQLIALIAD